MKIKGFDKDLKCRGMQFEVGKEYKIETNKEPELCTDTVFHYCDSLQKVHGYYSMVVVVLHVEIFLVNSLIKF